MVDPRDGNGRVGMSQAQDSFEATMAVLCRGMVALPDEVVVETLRHHAYQAGINAKRRVSSPWSPLHAGLDAFEALKVSYVAMGNPALLRAGPLHPREGLNGVDIRPQALRSFAEARCAHGMFVWAGAVEARAMPGIEDGLGYVADMDGFRARFLTTRFLRVVAPGVYADAVASSPLAGAGRVMAGWWAERLREAAGGDAERLARVPAFEAALADIVALVGSKVVKVDYQADGCLAYALSEAGLAHDALEGWGKTLSAANLSEGRVTAKVGYGGQHVVIGAP